MASPIVLLPADVREIQGYTWHAAITIYLDAVLKGAGATPLILPSYGSDIDLDSVLDRVDGVLMTGSKSNVHPSAYGAAATEKHEPFDEARDETAFPLIRRTLERGIPMLAICRGFQELNVALGGTLGAEIQERADRMDHRAPESDDNNVRFAMSHDVAVEPGGQLIDITASGSLLVNSLHRQGIEDLADGLTVEAIAPDGAIEAVRVTDAGGFALGVQWHPEYWVTADTPSRRIFEAFGEAIRAYAAGRAAHTVAAE